MLPLLILYWLDALLGNITILPVGTAQVGCVGVTEVIVGKAGTALMATGLLPQVVTQVLSATKRTLMLALVEGAMPEKLPVVLG